MKMVSRNLSEPERLVELTRRALVMERLARAFWPLASLAAAALALAVSGLLPRAGGLLHLGALALLVGAFSVALVQGIRDWRMPSRSDARVRLDRATETRPFATLADRPAIGVDDPFSVAAWDAHRRRALQAVRSARLRPPELALSSRDPWALRAASVLLLGAAFVYSGSDWRPRLASALQPDLSPRASDAAVLVSVEAWVEPPTYTGVAPIYLTEGEPVSLEAPLPGESKLEVRVFGAAAAPTLIGRPFDGPPSSRKFETVGERSHSVVWTLKQDTRVDLRAGGRDIRSWSFRVRPDTPPQIAFATPPQAARSGALGFAYRVRDDYGAARAWATIETDGAVDGGLLRLEPIELSLTVPFSRVEESEEFAIRDLTAHPWAGAEASITLWVVDDAGQTGRSDKVAFRLPARTFEEPMAGALAEQRRDLATARHAGDAAAALDVLEALIRRPHEYFADPVPYLAARAATSRLDSLIGKGFAHGRLDGVLDLLWRAALRLELGDLAEAQERLRESISDLQQALEDGAPDSEIARLMQNLRQALADFLRESVEREGMMAEGESVDDEILDQLLRDLQQNASAGQREAARRMLSQLEGLLENLRATGRLRMPRDTELGQLTREQTDLADQTQRYRDGRGWNADMPPEEIIRRQQELLERLESLTEEFGRRIEEGAGEAIMERFGQAAEAMRRALDMLRESGEGRDGRSGEGDGGRQGRDGERGIGEAAIPQMEAARNLGAAQAEWMRQQIGQGAAFGATGSRGGMGADPLGRLFEGPYPHGDVELIGGSRDTSARRLFEEIRRRAGDRRRQLEEREYLERLIDRF